MAQRKEDIATESDPDKKYRSYLEFNLQTRANALLLSDVLTSTVRVDQVRSFV